jgi:hypothetical protein
MQDACVHARRYPLHIFTCVQARTLLTSMPRFVVLRHDSLLGVHFDFMLEAGDALKTWALPQFPQPDVEMTCEALGDHRIAYLDYEGPISGDRGSVTRWESGTYRIVQQDAGLWIVELQGMKLTGRATLCAMPNDRQRWTFWFSPIPMENSDTTAV